MTLRQLVHSLLHRPYYWIHKSPQQRQRDRGNQNHPTVMNIRNSTVKHPSTIVCVFLHGVKQQHLFPKKWSLIDIDLQQCSLYTYSLLTHSLLFGLQTTQSSTTRANGFRSGRKGTVRPQCSVGVHPAGECGSFYGTVTDSSWWNIIICLLKGYPLVDAQILAITCVGWPHSSVR